MYLWLIEDFKAYIKLLKEKILVIAKILAYILKRYYNNSKTLKKKTNSLKLSRTRCKKLDFL
jgi:hypothetical protein